MTVQIDPEGAESRALQQFAGFEPGTTRVLEVGCGDGRLTWRYAGTARQVIGIDLVSDDLRVALIDRPADLAQRVSFLRAAAEHVPTKDGSFDLAIFAWSF